MSYWCQANERDFPYSLRKNTEDDYMDNIDLASDLNQLISKANDFEFSDDIRNEIKKKADRMSIEAWLEIIAQDYTSNVQKIIKAMGYCPTSGRFHDLDEMTPEKLIIYTFTEEDELGFVECITRNIPYCFYLTTIRKLSPTLILNQFWFDIIELSELSVNIGDEILLDLLGKGAIFSSEFEVFNPQKIVDLMTERKICNFHALYQLRDMGAVYPKGLISLMMDAPSSDMYVVDDDLSSDDD